MEPRVFRFFQYIESILSNFFTEKGIRSKTGASFVEGRATLSGKGRVTPETKETGNKGGAPTLLGRGHSSFVDEATGLVISKIIPKKESFSNGIFFLFVGFVIGNLFGTFLPSIRFFFSWDGFIVLFLLFFIEFISYIRYRGKSRFFLILWNFSRSTSSGEQGISFWNIDLQLPILFVQKRFSTPQGGRENGSFDLEQQKSGREIPELGSSAATFLDGWIPFSRYKSLNYFKIGFLLGFFIDAYKVGS